MGRILRIFLSGVLALLPIMVTVTVTAWVASLVASYAGPGSFLGDLITSLGVNVYGSTTIAYFVGLGIIIGSHEDLLQRMSLPDPLTGLANRRAKRARALGALHDGFRSDRIPPVAAALHRQGPSRPT